MVSILVPVYNCREYLHKCVASIQGQTRGDWELILINDGSTDGSGALCDSFAASDRRIRVIHQKNSGVSAARNAGLAAAKGEFLAFVDADDYIAPQTLEAALEALGESDMALFDAVTVHSQFRTEPDTIDLLPRSCVLKKEDITPALLRLLAGAVWRCVYRRSLVEGLRFPVGIKLSEDRLYNLQAMGKARTISYLKQGLYYRVERPGSAVHRYHGDKFEKNLQAMDIAQDTINQFWGEEFLPVYIRMFVVGGALDAIREIASKAYPGRHRLRAVRMISGHPALKEAFRQSPPEGWKEILLYRQADALLLAALWLWSLLH